MQKALHDDQVEATALFGFLSRTLDEMALRVGRLEEHAAEMISGASRRSELLVVLQDFDLIRQMMEDCARLCAAASDEGGAFKRTIAATMRLEALRDMLLHSAAKKDTVLGVNGCTQAGGGMVDLFEYREESALNPHNEIPKDQVAGKP